MAMAGPASPAGTAPQRAARINADRLPGTHGKGDLPGAVIAGTMAGQPPMRVEGRHPPGRPHTVIDMPR